ncbi:putative neutral sphingomyelinase [Eurytemora carolleeae]|uniref:putative neutral sphingomyelinase n=1 Tax=Eurytemora carolleeae TaxID=1294199 RepID=UPI000C764804|nr:putative neutral sphingomyelinase [Eurytemora carolleeae]|eukprot:XP_023324936.1 putative neutral sphingomyelinase [Eurytemora affinis]
MVLQALEAAQWIRLTSCAADLTIYAGDFNSEPTDVPFNILRQVGGLEDSWAVVNGSKEGGGTCGTPYNTYTTSKEKKEAPAGKRIDYILYTSGPKIQVSAVECKLPLPQRIPVSINYKQLSYSDHEGVAAVLKIENNQGKSGEQKRQSSEREQCLERATALVKNAVEASRKDKFIFLIISIFCLVCFLLTFSGT